MAEKLTYSSFIPLLVRAVPELRPLYEEHLRAYDELLPHVFMAEVTRFVVGSYYESCSETDAAASSAELLARIMDMLEFGAASTDIMLVNLVTVSFCENLLSLERDDPEAYQALRQRMGPKLAEQMHGIWEYWNLGK